MVYSSRLILIANNYDSSLRSMPVQHVMLGLFGQSWWTSRLLPWRPVVVTSSYCPVVMGIVSNLKQQASRLPKIQREYWVWDDSIVHAYEQGLLPSSAARLAQQVVRRRPPSLRPRSTPSPQPVHPFAAAVPSLRRGSIPSSSPRTSKPPPSIGPSPFRTRRGSRPGS